MVKQRGSANIVIAFIVGLTMLLTGIPLTAQAAAVGEWVQGEWGQVRLSSVANAKSAYVAGDVLRLAYRVEGNIAEPTDMKVTSTTVEGANYCNWAGLPAGTGAKYNCGYTAKVARDITYTITEADVEAGEATFATTWEPTGRTSGKAYAPITVSVTVPTATTPPVVWEDIVDGVPRTLAAPGDFGFSCHRIPALAQLANGWILAAWDGRPTGCGDAPQHNSIIQRISKDGGKSWEAPTVIAAGSLTGPTGKIGYSDPSFVVDREKNKVFAFFVKSFDQGFMGSRVGVNPDDRNVLHAVVVESTDNGMTWSDPRDITADITPDVAQWRSRFAASGAGIQLRYGAHKGRLLQQYTMADASSNAFQAVTVYSDDHGATWKAGTPVGTGMDENKVVELSDGTVMLNSRRSDRAGGRNVALSTDGGETYGDVTVDETLVDPRNNASIIRAYPNAPEGSAEAKVLLFSNANNASSRVNGTIRISYDDGRTWSGAKVFAPGAMSYSTLTPLATPGTYGLLYEGEASTIRYMQVSLDWLGALPVQVSGEQQTIHRGDNTVKVSVTNLSQQERKVLVGATAPTGWQVSEPKEIVLAGGASQQVEFQVSVPASTDPGEARLLAEATEGTAKASGSVPLVVELLDGQHPTAPVEGHLVGSLPAQPGEEPAKMLDGDIETMWHTPWRTSTPLPLDVCLSVGEEPMTLASLVQTPRQSGGSNGRIQRYEVLAGNDADSLSVVAAGQWPNSIDMQTVPLDVTATVVCLRVQSTYGDQSGLTFVSIAELGLRALVADDPVADPTPTPTEEPTGKPTDHPTGEATAEPTSRPTGRTSDQPTGKATVHPSLAAPVRPGLPATGC